MEEAAGMQEVRKFCEKRRLSFKIWEKSEQGKEEEDGGDGEDGRRR
ncbi:dna polymerase epsilon subunit c, partial [Lasius niger]